MQDATPITLGQEFSGYAAQVAFGIERVEAVPAAPLPAGPGRHGRRHRPQRPGRLRRGFAAEVARLTGLPFVTAPEQVRGDGGPRCDGRAVRRLQHARRLADQDRQRLRFAGSGPRSGIGELMLPENEPGSSIMPGKVNPTQAEALTMVAAQVMGNHRDGDASPAARAISSSTSSSRSSSTTCCNRAACCAMPASASPTIASSASRPIARASTNC